MNNKLALNIVICGLLSATQITMPMEQAKQRKPRNIGYFTNTPPNNIQAYHTYKNNRRIDDTHHEITYEDEFGKENTIKYILNKDDRFTKKTIQSSSLEDGVRMALYNAENKPTHIILRHFTNGTTTIDAIKLPQSEIQ